MVRVIWRNAALDDLDRIILYIRQFDPDAAERIGQRLVALGNSLSVFPHRGRPAAQNTREMVTVRPYILKYEIQGQEVHVLSVRHAKRLSGD